MKFYILSYYDDQMGDFRPARFSEELERVCKWSASSIKATDWRIEEVSHRGISLVDSGKGRGTWVPDVRYGDGMPMVSGNPSVCGDWPLVIGEKEFHDPFRGYRVQLYDDNINLPAGAWVSREEVPVVHYPMGDECVSPLLREAVADGKKVVG